MRHTLAEINHYVAAYNGHVPKSMHICVKRRNDYYAIDSATSLHTYRSGLTKSGAYEFVYAMYLVAVGFADKLITYNVDLSDWE